MKKTTLKAAVRRLSGLTARALTWPSLARGRRLSKGKTPIVTPITEQLHSSPEETGSDSAGGEGGPLVQLYRHLYSTLRKNSKAKPPVQKDSRKQNEDCAKLINKALQCEESHEASSAPLSEAEGSRRRPQRRVTMPTWCKLKKPTLPAGITSEPHGAIDVIAVRHRDESVRVSWKSTQLHVYFGKAEEGITVQMTIVGHSGGELPSMRVNAQGRAYFTPPNTEIGMAITEAESTEESYHFTGVILDLMYSKLTGTAGDSQQTSGLHVVLEFRLAYFNSGSANVGTFATYIRIDCF